MVAWVEPGSAGGKSEWDEFRMVLEEESPEFPHSLYVVRRKEELRKT